MLSRSLTKSRSRQIGGKWETNRNECWEKPKKKEYVAYKWVYVPVDDNLWFSAKFTLLFEMMLCALLTKNLVLSLWVYNSCEMYYLAETESKMPCEFIPSALVNIQSIILAFIDLFICLGVLFCFPLLCFALLLFLRPFGPPFRSVLVHCTRQNSDNFSTMLFQLLVQNHEFPQFLWVCTHVVLAYICVVENNFIILLFVVAFSQYSRRIH